MERRGGRGGGVDRHAFSVKAAIGRTAHCLGLDHKPVNIFWCPNREKRSGTVEAAPAVAPGTRKGAPTQRVPPLRACKIPAKLRH